MKVFPMYGLLVLVCVGFLEAVADQMESSLVKKLTAVCGKDGIKVTVRFSHPFSGIVYSDGHYDTPQCVFINQENSTRDSRETRFSFTIPADECGTIFHDPGSSLSSQYENETRNPANELANEVFMENTVMFQKHHLLQEQGDLAQTLRCVWQKEIRRPLQATLPLTGKQRHQFHQQFRQTSEKPSITAFPSKTPDDSEREIIRRFTPHPHHRQSQRQDHQYQRIPQHYRKRFNQKGQVENISFSRRTGKSMDFMVPPVTQYSFQNFRNLPNMTALAYKADDDHIIFPNARYVPSNSSSRPTVTRNYAVLMIVLQIFVNVTHS